MNGEIETKLKKVGAARVGFADLAQLPEGPRRGFPRAVCAAVALDPKVISRIPEGPFSDYDEEYVRRNTQLDNMGMSLEGWLREKGYGAFALTRERFPYSADTGYSTPLPHKTVARLSGFGWIGKGAVLVTKEYGTAVRLTTVLTDAPFATGRPVQGLGCGSCTACETACPAGAIRGESWQQGMDREVLVDAAACDTALQNRKKGTEIRHAACGLCLAACPHTRQYLKREGALG
ncbi:hypothetical protein LJC49_04385 [Ruminococcaceae bacterium OttesenSCG-928-I18]|nr:hypothetical protein [Ruminococcaceae bacterium OttesenSCG-928-I18]